MQLAPPKPQRVASRIRRHGQIELTLATAESSRGSCASGLSGAITMILLDSDVAVDLLRGKPQAIAWLASLGRQRITVPGYVAMELIQGCHDATELARTQRELANYDIVWPDAAACAQAMSVFQTSWLSHKLGLLDALIGQTAVGLGAPLHTFNVKHLGLVPGLKAIQPYTR